MTSPAWPSEQHVESARLYGIATQAISYDSLMVAQYAMASSEAQYVATTILLAAALFFAGVTSSFRYRPARILLVVAALGTLALAASRLATLPIA